MSVAPGQAAWIANYRRLQALQVVENVMQSNPKIDGVGMFPAQLAAFSATAQTSRVGADAR